MMLLAVIAPLLAMPALACTVSTGTLAFGAIDALLPFPTDSGAIVQVSCPEATDYSISLSAGGGSYGGRVMSSGAEALQYQLYVDASRLSSWGDGSGGSVLVYGSADADGSLHTVYGRVPHQPLAKPGTYSDSLLVTVSF